ncbi:MAG: NAD(P)-dependent oxidoreductase [Proteobacteria bacterium]|nr:MAG: NAD(P)-dependent oxidoreductase [Pseudomonadota bacterium]
MNCVGALVEHAKQQTASAILLNSYLPHFLSQIGKDLGFKLIHISTDCVFSGKDGGYTETSFRDGDDAYARSKALGEVINDKDLTIRTSIIGPELKQHGASLFDFFLKQKGNVKGYSKALWSGVTTLALAQALPEFMDKNICGLYHLTNGEPISKYNLLKLLHEHVNKSVSILESDIYVVDKSLKDTRALIRPIPNYNVMITDMVSFMRKNVNLYAHYQLGG